MDSNGDGIGDLAGVVSKLDYLAWLGVDAIWFSPTFPSPMKDFGYDVADYTGVHPNFGTMADFDKLLHAATAHGIKIILDLVPNHTSDEHPWFIESRSSRDNPKRDWYLWQDPAPDGGPPNNWLAFFGGSAWELDEATGQYYLHSFLKEQPDLNWRNPEVREAMFDAVRFWLKKGVAGFRIDSLDFVIKDAQFRDDPPNPNYDRDKQLPRHAVVHKYSAYQDEVHDVVKAMREVFDEHEAVLIGEIDYAPPLETVISYYGKENDEMTLPVNFKLITMTSGGAQPTADEFSAFIRAYDSALPIDAWPNYVLGNHDRMRLGSRVGLRERVLAMLLLTLRGTPFIYYGEELGMRDVDIPLEQQQDPFGINIPGQGRDPARTPMQWNADRNAGFTTGEPWLPVSPDFTSVNVGAQQADPRSMLNMYRALLTLRREVSALQLGRYYPVEGTPDDTIVYVRQYNDQRVLVMLNFGDAENVVSMQGEGRVVLSTLMDRVEENEHPLAAVELRPYEGVIIALPSGTRTMRVVS